MATTLLSLDFLTELTLISSQSDSADKFVREINYLFNKYYNFDNFKIFIYNKKEDYLYDFSKDWQLLNPGEAYLKDIIKNIDTDPIDKPLNILYLDGKIFDFTYKKEIEVYKNSKIHLALKVDNTIIALLEFSTQYKTELMASDIRYLEIASAQITSFIKLFLDKRNLIREIDYYEITQELLNHFEKRLSFNNIGRILGEVLDKFLTGHLVYIFAKSKNSLHKLLWPKNCIIPDIYDILSTMNNGYKILKDKNIGVFTVKVYKNTCFYIVVYDKGTKIPADDIKYLAQISVQLELTMQKSYLYAQKVREANIDSLTFLNNRRAFDNKLPDLLEKAIATNMPLSFLLLDIDYFKNINDEYGHLAGDKVLTKVAKIIKSQIRLNDFAARYGGEEFAIILPDTTSDKAVILAERMRKIIENTKFYYKKDKYLKSSVSIGVSSTGEDCNKIRLLIQKADTALYLAKQNGRNLVTGS